MYRDCLATKMWLYETTCVGCCLRSTESWPFKTLFTQYPKIWRRNILACYISIPVKRKKYVYVCRVPFKTSVF